MADKTRYEPPVDPSIPKSEDSSGEISSTNDTENIHLNHVPAFMETSESIFAGENSKNIDIAIQQNRRG